MDCIIQVISAASLGTVKLVDCFYQSLKWRLFDVVGAYNGYNNPNYQQNLGQGSGIYGGLNSGCEYYRIFLLVIKIFENDRNFYEMFTIFDENRNFFEIFTIFE